MLLCNPLFVSFQGEGVLSPPLDPRMFIRIRIVLRRYSKMTLVLSLSIISLYLTCIMGNAFCQLQNQFSKKKIRNYSIWLSIGLDMPSWHQAWQNVRPDIGQICLQKLSTDYNSVRNEISPVMSLGVISYKSWALFLMCNNSIGC